MRRLITRSDLDGLVCAILLKELDMIDTVLFANPRDVQDGYVDLYGTDITANLPFDRRVGLAFDHHESELIRLRSVDTHRKLILDVGAKSAARVMYDYYGGRRNFGRIPEDLMVAVDKVDSGDFSVEEVLNPRGWVLLGFILDMGTGFGSLRKFNLTDYDFMMGLMAWCLSCSIEEVMELPDVRERTELYFEHSVLFREQIERLIQIEGRVGIVDLRGEGILYAGNRYLLYALYPEVDFSIYLARGRVAGSTVVMVGESILSRGSGYDIGYLCLKRGGGGHRNEGTCVFRDEVVDEMLRGILEELNC